MTNHFIDDPEDIPDPNEEVYTFRFQCSKSEIQIVGHWNKQDYRPAHSAVAELIGVKKNKNDSNLLIVEGPYSKVRLACLHPDFLKFFEEGKQYFVTISRVTSKDDK